MTDESLQSSRAKRHADAHRHRWFRRWHRWLGIGAAIFLLFASITGFIVAFTEFFGPAERLREANRKLVSPITTSNPPVQYLDQINKAVEAVDARTHGATIDKLDIEFKGQQPRIIIATGKPGGGEDREFVVDARSGRIISESAYADKPFLYRLHSGEALGDGGLVLAMFWAIALILMTLSGIYIYFTMRRRESHGLKRFFW